MIATGVWVELLGYLAACLTTLSFAPRTTTVLPSGYLPCSCPNNTVT